MSDKIMKKHQFQIRKVPIKKTPPQKIPQLYALDVFPVGKSKFHHKNLKWSNLRHLHSQISRNNYQNISDEIIYSNTYQQLYLKYCALKQQKQRQKNNLQAQLNTINEKLQKQQRQKHRLINLKDNLFCDIQNYKQQLSQYRNKNYNLRWQIYHQRGGYYVNYDANNYSFFQNAQPTYEDYLFLEEQIGAVPKGLNEIELALLPKQQYKQIIKQHQENPENNLLEKQNNLNQKNNQIIFTKQICCICYDDINQGQYVTILKCKHIHHCQCIKDWLAKQKNCPICKKEVILDQFHLKKSEINQKKKDQSKDQQ